MTVRSSHTQRFYSFKFGNIYRKTFVLVPFPRYTCRPTTRNFVFKIAVDSVFPKNFAKVFRWAFLTEHLRALSFVFYYSYQYEIYHFSTTVIRILIPILTETVVQRCSVKKVFLEISQNILFNLCIFSKHFL